MSVTQSDTAHRKHRMSFLIEAKPWSLSGALIESEIDEQQY